MVTEELPRQPSTGKVLCQLIFDLSNTFLRGTSSYGIPICEAKVGLGLVSNTGLSSKNEPLQRLVLTQVPANLELHKKSPQCHLVPRQRSDTANGNPKIRRLSKPHQALFPRH